jgi:hypothetical protein
MKTRDERSLLREKIIVLENSQKEELMSLKEALKSTYESIQPLNLLKSTLHELTSSVEVQSDLVTGAGNIISVLISKNPIIATFQKPINKLINHLLRFVINRFSEKKKL